SAYSLTLLRLPAASLSFSSFFFLDPLPPFIYTLSLHDALPIFPRVVAGGGPPPRPLPRVRSRAEWRWPSVRRSYRCGGGCSRRRSESTRLNSSHVSISYAVFCLKKKKKIKKCIISLHSKLGFS